MSEAEANLGRRRRYSRIAHGELAFAGPYPQSAVDEVLARLAHQPPATALDLGCGRAELLMQLATSFRTQGVGVDPDHDTLELARAKLLRRDLGSRLRLITGEARTAVMPTANDFVSCLGASHAVGGWREVWPALLDLARPGGLILLGEGHWLRPPDPEYLELLGGSVTDLPTADEVLAAPALAGATPLWSRSSTPAEWSDYESRYHANMMEHLCAHPDDQDAEAFRARSEQWYAAFQRWGRSTLGFILILAQAPKRTPASS